MTYLLTLIGGPANLTQLVLPFMPTSYLYRVPFFEPSTAYQLHDDPNEVVRVAEYEVAAVGRLLAVAHLVGTYLRTV